MDEGFISIRVIHHGVHAAVGLLKPLDSGLFAAPNEQRDLKAGLFKRTVVYKQLFFILFQVPCAFFSGGVQGRWECKALGSEDLRRFGLGAP